MTTAPNRTALTRPAPTRPALARSVPFWILLVASVALAAVGAVTIAQHLGSMTKTLTDGSATGLDVYAGQSWVVVGAVLLGAGVLGLLLTLALAAASALLIRTAPAPVSAPFEAPYNDGLSDPEGALDAPAFAHEIRPETAAPVQTAVESADASDDEGTSETPRSADDASAEGADPENEAQNGSSGSTATATKTNVK
jgi:hypothetical protein